MVRQVTCCIPRAEYNRVKEVLQSRSCVHRLKGWHIENDQSMIQFKIAETRTTEIIGLLTKYGVGVREEDGTIDIFAMASTKPRVRTQRSTKKKAYSIFDRLSYEEIYDMVDGQIQLTFDFIAFILVAAFIAAVGLIQDSAVTVVASMLVSPLMGPIVGMTFGAIIRDAKMFLTSLRNELLGVGLCWVTGFVIGLCMSPFIDEANDMAMTPNTEMSSRGTASGLLPGLFIAIPSGCGVALGITGDQINPLVGVAISAALLPPLVNSGVAIALGVMHLNDEYVEEGVYDQHITVGTWSACLFLMNWVVIFTFGYITFMVKRLHHHKASHKREEKLGRFNKFASCNSFSSFGMDDHMGSGSGLLRTMTDFVTSSKRRVEYKSGKTSNKKILSKPLLDDTYTTLPSLPLEDPFSSESWQSRAEGVPHGVELSERKTNHKGLHMPPTKASVPKPRTRALTTATVKTKKPLMCGRVTRAQL